MVNPLDSTADTVAPRSLLFLGGTGVISGGGRTRRRAGGHRLTILNRGQSGNPVPDGAEALHADVRDAAAVREVLGGREFDAVANFIAYKPDQARTSLELLRGRTGQYVFSFGVPEAAHPAAHHGIHFAEKSVLAVFAGQNRLRGHSASPPTNTSPGTRFTRPRFRSRTGPARSLTGMTATPEFENEHRFVLRPVVVHQAGNILRAFEG